MIWPIPLFVCLILISAGLRSQPSPAWSLTDRDRLVREETKLEFLEKSMDKRFGEVNQKFAEVDKRFDRLQDKFDSYFTWGFGRVIMAITGLVGFIIYDRRTTLAPVEQRNRQLLEVLRGMSKDDPKIEETP